MVEDLAAFGIAVIFTEAALIPGALPARAVLNITISVYNQLPQPKSPDGKTSYTKTPWIELVAAGTTVLGLYAAKCCGISSLATERVVERGTDTLSGLSMIGKLAKSCYESVSSFIHNRCKATRGDVEKKCFLDARDFSLDKYDHPKTSDSIEEHFTHATGDAGTYYDC